MCPLHHPHPLAPPSTHNPTHTHTTHLFPGWLAVGGSRAKWKKSQNLLITHGSGVCIWRKVPARGRGQRGSEGFLNPLLCRRCGGKRDVKQHPSGRSGLGAAKAEWWQRTEKGREVCTLPWRALASGGCYVGRLGGKRVGVAVGVSRIQ